MSVRQLLASTTTNIDLKSFRVEMWSQATGTPTMSVTESSRRFGESTVHFLHPEAVLAGASELLSEGVPAVRVQRDVYRTGQLVRIFLSPSHTGGVLEFCTPQEQNSKIMVPCGRGDATGLAQTFLAVSRNVLNQAMVLNQASANVPQQQDCQPTAQANFQPPAQANLQHTAQANFQHTVQAPFQQSPAAQANLQQKPGPSRTRKRGGGPQQFDGPRFKPDPMLKVSNEEWGVFPEYATRFVEYAKSGKPFPSHCNAHNILFWSSFFPQVGNIHGFNSGDFVINEGEFQPELFDSPATADVRQLVVEPVVETTVSGEVKEQSLVENCEGSAGNTSAQSSTSQEGGHKSPEETPEASSAPAKTKAKPKNKK